MLGGIKISDGKPSRFHFNTEVARGNTTGDGVCLEPRSAGDRRSQGRRHAG